MPEASSRRWPPAGPGQEAQGLKAAPLQLVTEHGLDPAHGTRAEAVKSLENETVRVPAAFASSLPGEYAAMRTVRSATHPRSTRSGGRGICPPMPVVSPIVSEIYQGRRRSGAVGDAFATPTEAYIGLRLANGSRTAAEDEPKRERTGKQVGLGPRRYIVRKEMQDKLDKNPELKDPPHGAVFGKSQLFAMIMDEVPRGRRRLVKASEPSTPPEADGSTGEAKAA